GERAIERPSRSQGQEILLLRGDEIRAVDAEERLTLRHRLADEVDEDTFHEPRDLDVDVAHPRLVDGDPPDGAPGGSDGAHRDRRDAEPDELLASWIDGDRREALGLALRGRGRGLVRGVRIQGIRRLYRHELHPADRALTGMILRDRRVHRALPELRL